MNVFLFYLFQEKEKLYVELKHILARQPGPEVAEQLQIYQQTLKDKTKQLKVGMGYSISNPYTPCGRFGKVCHRGGVNFQMHWSSVWFLHTVYHRWSKYYI